MTAEDDIFGTALADYFRGKKDSELLIHSEDEKTYAIPLEVFFRPAELLELDKTALGLCYGSVLDVGAGAGGHALYLQEKGFRVTALDISPAACEVMKRRGVNNVLQLNILEAHTLTGFDTWLVLGRSIGMVEDMQGFQSFLKLAKASLPSGGRLVLNSQNNSDKNTWRTRKLQFEFAGKKGKPISWFDIGEELILQEAAASGFLANVVQRDDHGNYLAVLTPSQQPAYQSRFESSANFIQ